MQSWLRDTIPKPINLLVPYALALWRFRFGSVSCALLTPDIARVAPFSFYEAKPTCYTILEPWECGEGPTERRCERKNPIPNSRYNFKPQVWEIQGCSENISSVNSRITDILVIN